MNPLEHNTLLQNRYLIGQMIGRGGAGEVYLAIDQRIGAPVVMKRTYYAGSDVLGGGFESEARALERVRHQVLPKVTDHFVEQGDQFLVMEFVPGDDLAKRLAASQKPFPLSWVMFWADQILDALIYLHSNEPPIFHRDIKPQNLKLTEQNNILLLDFGLSQGAVAKLEGQAGVPAQTKPFASLEQIRGGATNARSDVYSLASTLYFLLTGVVPADAATRADAVLGGVADPLVSPGSINSEVSPTISEVILKGMSVSHDQRFADARGMQKALREAYARANEPAGDKTVVMNEPEPQPSGFETLVMPHPVEVQEVQPEPPASAEDMGAKTIPFGMIAAEPETPPAGFDATVRYDGPIEGAADAASETPAQSNIRTEVFIKPDINIDDLPPPPAETSPMEPPTPSEPYLADATMPILNLETPSPAPNLTASEAKFDSVPSVPPFDTSPNANLESASSAPQFETSPNAGFESEPAVSGESTQETNRFSDSVDFSNVTAAGAGFAETVASPMAPEPEPSTPAAVAASAPKKSRKGFLIGILVGLFLLLVLGAGGAGLAYYAYTTPGGLGGLFGGSPTPTPMVTPETTPSATPSETPTATPEASPSESPSESPSPSETPTPETTPDGRSTPVSRTPVPATPRPTTSRTPRPTPVPTIKPSPKPSLRGRDIPQ